MATHEVINQPDPLVDYDVYGSDPVLGDAITGYGAGWAHSELSGLGRLAGSAEAVEWGFKANEYTPVLHTHDRFGHRIDEVEYHPYYHRLMETAVANGLHAEPWRDPRPGAHVARAARFFVWSQVDTGHTCPVSMTYAIVPAMRHQPEVASAWEPLLESGTYDPRSVPPGEKTGAIAGMAMTEKQGGSDVRANTSTATPTADGSFRLTGHKWFCSAPMSDVFLMLAQAPGGISCFAVPRFAPSGEPNGIQILRLKDKLGNRSNASSEIEFADVYGELVGEEGAGVRTIIEMVNHTRLDCVTGSASSFRQGLVQAVHHSRQRTAFGHLLIDQPLMLNVLADLAVESEAATLTMVRLAAAYDSDDPAEAAFRRIATAVGKYWVTKRLPMAAAEAMECLGGSGYVEESIMPRLFRDSPVNAIWEGSGNVIALDVLRAMSREPESLEALLAELETTRGSDPRYDRSLADLHAEISDTGDIVPRARRLTELMAVLLQGSLLIRHGRPEVTDAYCATRLAGDRGLLFGTLPGSTDHRRIVEGSFPG